MKAKKFDCGKYGYLTTKEIMEMTGSSSSAIRDRIYNVKNNKRDPEFIIDGYSHKKIYCGEYGYLTIEEIQEKTGLTLSGAWSRAKVNQYNNPNKIINGNGNKYGRRGHGVQGMKIFDCGIYGNLNARDISKINGMDTAAIYARVRKLKYTKEHIVDGKHLKESTINKINEEKRG